MKRSNEGIQNSSSEFHSKRIKATKDFHSINEILKYIYFYIDKSLLIKEFLEDNSLNGICITRPSNYGKTTNLIMLREFFKMNYDNEENQNKFIFENLNIAKEVNEHGQRYIDQYLGKYPVIYLDFYERIIGNSYDETINNFKSFIKELYIDYDENIIENLDDNAKEIFENYRKGNIDEANLMNSISFLCYCLKKSMNQEIILLIDNYDLLILNAFNTEFYDKFYSFYKNVFMKIFIGNKKHHYLFKTFITGKIYTSFLKEFPLKYYSIKDDKYNEYYSVTSFELKNLLSELK